MLGKCFAYDGLFFVVEALKTVKNPLNCFRFSKSVKFFEKVSFFQKIARPKWGKGVPKHTLPSYNGVCLLLCILCSCMLIFRVILISIVVIRIIWDSYKDSWCWICDKSIKEKLEIFKRNWYNFVQLGFLLYHRNYFRML